MPVLAAIVWAIGASTALFLLIAAAADWLFLREKPLRSPSQWPAVTILKPLKGAEPELYANLESFCRQDYPDYQIIFALDNENDPALDVISRLRRKYPQRDIAQIVSDRRIGLNPKINNIANAEPLIKHDLILMSDSDIKADAGFLRRMTAPLADPAVGLTTSFYRCAPPGSIWQRLEALSIDAQFLPQALFAAACGMRFAMGAAILVRRQAFDQAGGFQKLADHLADDFILGEGVREAGWKIEFARGSVESVPTISGFSEHLLHQIRWARTIRLCNPSGHMGTLILHGFSLLTLKMLFFGIDPISLNLAVTVILSRFIAQSAILFRLEKNRSDFRGALLSLALIPMAEWISFAAWVASFYSTRVFWRGQTCLVGPRGRLTAAASPAPAKTGPLLTVE